MLIEENTFLSLLEGHGQKLDICHHMIQSGAGAAKDKNPLCTKLDCKVHRNLCVRQILHRIEFPDRNLRKPPEILQGVPGSRVEISHDMGGADSFVP